MKKIVTILLLLVALTGRAQAPKGQVELLAGLFNKEHGRLDLKWHYSFFILN